jgi:hypothetical protein
VTAPLTRTDLFPTPVWSVDLTELAEHVPAMVAEAEAVLERSPADDNDLFEQSRAVLQASTEPGWVEFFRIIAAHMEAIVGRDLPAHFGIERAYLRSWVLRIDDPSAHNRIGSTLDLLHSHLPSVLSSVFYLQVPTALVEASHGGTTFRDPNAAVTRAYRRPDVQVAAAPLRLVIFPSHLEHCPERPAPATVFDRPRLVVSTDLRVEPT